jgi:hypothetical protein
LNRPGGNLTGVSFLAEALVPRRFELLRQIAPSAGLIGYLVNPSSPQIEARIKGAEVAARTLGTQLVILKSSNTSEIDTTFTKLAAQRIGALFTDADPLFFTRRHQVIALAARHAVPVMFQVRDIVDDGGLVSYGANLGDVFRLAGNYAGRVLKGEKPADLPVQQPTRFELVLNLKTARALGPHHPRDAVGNRRRGDRVRRREFIAGLAARRSAGVKQFLGMLSYRLAVAQSAPVVRSFRGSPQDCGEFARSCRQCCPSRFGICIAQPSTVERRIAAKGGSP